MAFKFISAAMAIYICEFLCEPQYNYRIRCIFEDDKNLFTDQVWTCDIMNTYQAIKDGKDTLDLQYFDGTGYTCDICRCEISRYEWMYHCTAEHSHDYCLSCIYSIISQHKEMKQFINDCLLDLLNADCIEQIITFCMGTVTKFDITN